MGVRLCFDTSAVLTIVTKNAAARRQLNEHVLHHGGDEYEVMIPAPCIIELLTLDPVEILRRLNATVLQLDTDAALVGQRLWKKHHADVKNEKRGVKYDLMIAAIALSAECEFLFTANERDFRRYLDSSSKTQLIDITKALPGQQSFPL